MTTSLGLKHPVLLKRRSSSSCSLGKCVAWDRSLGSRVRAGSGKAGPLPTRSPGRQECLRSPRPGPLILAGRSPPCALFPVTPSSPVCAGASLGVHAAVSEEPGSEGLPSTSLLDLLLPTGLEPLDSEEPSEAVGLGAGLGAPGSGFPSEESEESRILQPPQYFWEEEDALNESSLGLGPTAGTVLACPCFWKVCLSVFWLRWVLAAELRLPLATVHGLLVSVASCCSAGFWHRGSAVVAPGLWCAGSVVVAAAGLCCPSVHGSLPDQGWNPCLLRWQVGS